MKAAMTLSVGCLLLAASGALVAAEQPQVVLSIEMAKEMNVPDGHGNIRVVRTKAGPSQPGDVLVYTLVYTNTGATPVADAKVKDAVPEGTVLLPASVSGEKANVTFSVDGGKSYAPYPVEVETREPDGKTLRKKAPAGSYTHILWSSSKPLNPGESRTASFKVLVK